MIRFALFFIIIVYCNNVFADYPQYGFQQYGSARKAYHEYLADKNASHPSPISQIRGENSGITVYGKKFRTYADFVKSPEYKVFQEMKAVNKSADDFAFTMDKEIAKHNQQIFKYYNKNRTVYELYRKDHESVRHTKKLMGW